MDSGKFERPIDNEKESVTIKSNGNQQPYTTTARLKNAKVEYREVEKLERPLTDEEIIQKVGGGDETKGSCVSLAYAYAGNKNGLDVTDYRGGKSLDIIATSKAAVELVNLQNVNGKVVRNTNDYKAAHDLLYSCESNKEYIFACGRHATIIKRNGNEFQYLELQTSKGNGYKTLNNAELKKRFGCQKSHSLHGTKIEQSSFLIEVGSLKGNSYFKECLGYINTAPNMQKKGQDGNVK